MEAILVAGLGFGDEGKGATVDYLVRRHRARLVVRYNGGAQAAHNVVEPGTHRHHTFAQFGAGTLTGAYTFLSRYMVVNPMSMLVEQSVLRDTFGGYHWDHMLIDPRAILVTPFHKALNRLWEAERGNHQHGSCGMGIGCARWDALARWDVLRTADTTSLSLTTDKLHELQTRYKEITRHMAPDLDDQSWRTLYNDRLPEYLAGRYHDWQKLIRLIRWEDLLDDSNLRSVLDLDHTPVVFEGAQGVLLDEKHGFFPYNTWTDTTFNNAMQMIRGWKHTKIGVLRSYHTRHGAGPFVTENFKMSRYPELHNNNWGFQGEFRIGHFDAVAARYAVEVAQPHELYLTHMDRMTWRIGVAYRINGQRVLRLKVQPQGIQAGFSETLKDATPEYIKYYRDLDMLSILEEKLQVPITVIANGRTAEDRIRREAWRRDNRGRRYSGISGSAVSTESVS